MSNILSELRTFCNALGIPFNDKASTVSKIRTTQHYIENMRAHDPIEYEEVKKEFNAFIVKYNRTANLDSV